jgi:hypothetical protein
LPQAKSDSGLDDSIVSQLTALQSEYAQLSELDEMERNYILKLIDSLKALQSGIDSAIPLHVAALGIFRSKAKEAYLASDGVVIIHEEGGKPLSVPLSRFPAKDVLAIVQDATPEIGRIVSERRREIGARVELLERVLKEMKKAGGMVRQAQPAIADADEDLVQNSIASEQ